MPNPLFSEGDVLAEEYRINEKLRDAGPFEIYDAQGPRGERATVYALQPQYTGLPTVVPALKIAAARLSAGAHLRVAGYHACVETPRTVAMVAEGDSRRTLADLLRARGTLEPEEAAVAALRIVEALEFIHGKDIVHGALSPAAVLLGPGDDVRQLRLSCAGLAEALRGRPYPGAVDDPYAAPERRQGGDALPQSDIYSLGVLLYRMLTGQVPPTGSTSARDIDPEIDPELDSIVSRCLAEQPNARFASAQDLRRVLLRVAEPFLHPRRGAARARRARPLVEHPIWPVVVGVIYALLLPAAIAVPPLVLYAHWRSTEPREVVVPNIVGMSVDEARQTLAQRNLSLAIVDQVYDPQIPAGQVVWAKPRAGKVVKEGRMVYARVSRGARSVEVPDVTSIDLDSAKQALAEVGLRAGRIERAPSSILARNAVLSQCPKPGRRIPEGSTVDLLISSGPEKLPPPRASGPLKSSHVVVTVPRGPRTQRVQIKLRQGGVERTVYDELHEPGDRVDEPVSGRGTLEILVYVNGKLVKREKL